MSKKGKRAMNLNEPVFEDEQFPTEEEFVDLPDEPEEPSSQTVYELQRDDNLHEVFEAGFDHISSLFGPTREQRVVAYNNGYRIVSRKDARLGRFPK